MHFASERIHGIKTSKGKASSADRSLLGLSLLPEQVRAHGALKPECATEPGALLRAGRGGNPRHSGSAAHRSHCLRFLPAAATKHGGAGPRSGHLTVHGSSPFHPPTNPSFCLGREVLWLIANLDLSPRTLEETHPEARERHSLPSQTQGTPRTPIIAWH